MTRARWRLIASVVGRRLVRFDFFQPRPAAIFREPRAWRRSVTIGEDRSFA